MQQAMPALAGCVLSRAVERQPREDGAAFNAVLECWFHRPDDAQAAVTARALDALLADGVDLYAVIVGMERTVVRLPEHRYGQGVKGVYPFCRKPDMVPADFYAHWWHRHGPIAGETEQALAYFQCHPLNPVVAGEVGFDGVTQIHWRNVDEALDALASRQMVEDQAEDAERFVDLDSVQLLLVAEEVVIAP